ncbi:MAG: alpha-amylase family glycosyl hydrolase [Promethearchaeota archaeon]
MENEQFAQRMWKLHPRILEINTWPWLNRLSEKYFKPITLDNVPKEVFEEDFTSFDVIWLMGVWTRSSESKKIAQKMPELKGDYHSALFDYNDDDVIGSPYAIYDYSCDPHLGGQDALENFAKRLHFFGKLLILDFVPNHLAVDHPWLIEHPKYFVRGTESEILNNSKTFFSKGDNVFAHGKDPYFDAWTDTAQLNMFCDDLRANIINILKNMARYADGVRCDMAMLADSGVFRQTWGSRVGTTPDSEYWEEIISSVKSDFSEFKFIAEVYWDMEWRLMQQGFDFCYDKRLRDRLLNAPFSEVHAHLKADWDYQRKLIRFVENHDEKRALPTFGLQKSKLAAALTLTLPGAHLIHFGQCQGWSRKLPVQLKRYPKEPIVGSILTLYNTIFNFLGTEFGKEGSWQILNPNIKPYWGEDTPVIAYFWKFTNEILLICLNFSSELFKCNFRIENLNLGKDLYMLKDVFDGSNNSFPKQLTINQKEDEILEISLKIWGIQMVRYVSSEKS